MRSRDRKRKERLARTARAHQQVIDAGDPLDQAQRHARAARDALEDAVAHLRKAGQQNALDRRGLNILGIFASISASRSNKQVRRARGALAALEQSVKRLEGIQLDQLRRAASRLSLTAEWDLILGGVAELGGDIQMGNRIEKGRIRANIALNRVRSALRVLDAAKADQNDGMAPPEAGAD